jgi:hypothetical protein
MGWRAGFWRLGGPLGGAAAYDFRVGGGAKSAQEIYDVLQPRLRAAKNLLEQYQNALDTPVIADATDDFDPGSADTVQMFSNCAYHKQTKCWGCCQSQGTVMYESMEFVKHSECCFGYCPGEFRAYNKFYEGVLPVEDPCCATSSLTSGIYDTVTQKMGEDARKLAFRGQATGDPDQEFILNSCCWIKDCQCCPKESFTLKSDTMEFTQTQCFQPLVQLVSPTATACFTSIFALPLPCTGCGLCSPCAACLCLCPCPYCSRQRVSVKYASIDRVEMNTLCFPCCCLCGDGFLRVTNKSYPIACMLIPGRCLGTFCCHSNDIEPAYHQLLKRSAGTSENTEAIAQITDASGADIELKSEPSVELPAVEAPGTVVPVPVPGESSEAVDEKAPGDSAAVTVEAAAEEPVTSSFDLQTLAQGRQCC